VTPALGDEQQLGYEELLAVSRESLEAGTDLTIAVEEEFALLDPDTLGLVNRFEELRDAAQGTELGDNLAGELIASEIEVKTGKCDSLEEALRLMEVRREQLHALASQQGVALGAAGTHPWSPWQEQRIIDTPHYRRNDELLRYVVWRNNTFGIHVHVGVAGADRAIRLHDALRVWLPDLLALSASSPFVEDVNSGLHTARTQIFTRFFPRCGVPDPYGDWQTFEAYVRFLYETGSMTEHTQLWWSVRPHLAFPTVEVRICDAQPDLEEARGLVTLVHALCGRILRAVDEGERLPEPPPRLIEENLWRAIRYGLAGELIDLGTGRVRPAREAIAELADWAEAEIEIPAANSAERQIARHAEGETLRDIYAEEAVRCPVKS
jgi:glutamate---cysteine ligase / carboxylate-amine ligase